MERLKELFHNKKFVMILSAIVIVAAGVGIGVFAYQSTRPKEVVAKVETKEKVKKEVVEVPTFTACSLEGESIEKDLTLIMKGDDGQKVSDVPFQVKLIPADQKEKIADAVQKIADVDAKIAELQAQADAKTTDTKKEDTKKTAKKKQEVSSLTGEAVTPLEQLYIDKQEAIASYKETLSMVNA